MVNRINSNQQNRHVAGRRRATPPNVASIVPKAMAAIGASLISFLILSHANAQGTYLAAPSGADEYPYAYHNTFPKGVGDFVSTAEVGGDVFAQGIEPGDSFPTDITIYDMKNEPHKISELIQNDRPLMLVLSLISSPTVMDDVARFQKIVDAENPESKIVLINVAQFGAKLQPDSRSSDTGRTLRIVADEHDLTLPFYWVDNDIYSADGFTNRLRARDLPTYVLLDSEGKVVRVYGSDHTQWAARDFSISN